MKSSTLNSHLDEIGVLIREGRLEIAFELLEKINRKTLLRENLLPIARLFRRAGRPLESLNLLYPLVSDPSANQPISVEELSEYALALAKVGGVEEAIEHLRGTSTRPPEVVKTLGLCAMSMWDYELAEKELREYLASADADNYETLVLRVNFVACLVFQEKQVEADLELGLLSKDLRGGSIRLRSNCHELKAQILLQRGDTSGALAELKTAETLLQGAATNDVLFLKKWRSYLSALTTKDIAPLTTFKKEALKLKHWESVRDSDRLALKVKFDDKRFRFLYFGTPHVAYRKYLLRQFAYTGDELQSFTRGKKGARNLDLGSGLLDGRMALKPGQGLHRILLALLGDFYRPLSIPALHWKGFPNQHFNPHSSPLKVHQTLHRLRAWILKESLPLEIEEHDGHFAVRVNEGVAVEIPIALSVLSTEQHNANQVRKVLLDGRARTARDLAEVLGWSRPKIQRALKWSIEQGFIRRDGSGRDARYLLTP